MADRADGFDFFISYASPDVGTARLLYEKLSKEFKVFFDQTSQNAGTPWGETITRALRSSRVIVALVSRHTHQAYYEQEEIALAVECARNSGDGKHVIPVLLDPTVQLPFGLTQLKALSVDYPIDICSIADELAGTLGRAPTQSSVVQNARKRGSSRKTSLTKPDSQQLLDRIGQLLERLHNNRPDEVVKEAGLLLCQVFGCVLGESSTQDNSPTTLERLLSKANKRSGGKSCALNAEIHHGLMFIANWYARVVRHVPGESSPSVDDALRISYSLRVFLVNAKFIRPDEWNQCNDRVLLRCRQTARPRAFLDRTLQIGTVESIIISENAKMGALIVHGELDQGHDHFSDFLRYKIKKEHRLLWRDLEIKWPALGETSNRYAEIQEQLWHRLAPRQATSSAMLQTSMQAAIKTRIQESATEGGLLVRHTISRPLFEDDALLQQYMRDFWLDLDSQGLVYLIFEVVRTESPVGFGSWFSKTARLSKREIRVTRQIVRSALELGLTIVPELGSVTVGDLETYLCQNAKLDRSARRDAANHIYLASRRGRYELAVKCLDQISR